MYKNVGKKDVVILSTHIVNNYVIQKYRKLCVELNKEKYDILLLLNVDEGHEWHIPEDIVFFNTLSLQKNATQSHKC